MIKAFNEVPSEPKQYNITLYNKRLFYFKILIKHFKQKD